MSESAIRRLHNRIMMVLGRGVVVSVDDTGPLQLMQVKLGPNEVRDRTPVYGLFGFSSNAPRGAGMLAAFFGGNRTGGAAIATSHSPSRPRNLLSGESVVYNILGQKLYLSTTGMQLIGDGSLPLTITGFTQVTCACDIHVTGTIHASGDVIAAGVSLVNHLTNGVQAGSDLSGKPMPS